MRFRFGLIPALGLMLALFGGGAAGAEERIALIIGNGQYASIAQLDNPVSDADLMADVLSRQGFRVTKLTDASQITLNRGIAQFGRDLREAGEDATGLFYYAGHAVQSFGTNYLLPVDASLTDAADLGLVAVQADAVLRQMFSARNRTNIVILDACRNNPFEAIADLNDNGLAEMKSPTGTFLSYSTAPGAVALDGLDGNSPFTKSLAREVQTAGQPIEKVFKNVRVDVIAKTAGQQTPWDTSSLTGEFFFEAKAPLSEAQLAEMQLWESVRDTTDPVPLLLFIRGYPDSVHMSEARARLSDLMAQELAPDGTRDTDSAAPADTQSAALAPPADTVTNRTVEQATQTGPEMSEQALIGVAQRSGAAADYQAYLDAYPAGIYAELAAFELDALAARAGATPAPDATDGPLTFVGALISGGSAVEGKSIEMLIGLSPLFSPIEGLPDELWKDQTCSNCHQWTQQTLCDQGKTYAAANNTRAVSKTHPFGGGFKQNLRDWAATGCK